MRIYWFSFLVGMIVLFSFQNCQKASNQDPSVLVNANPIDSHQSSSNQNTNSKLELSQYNISSIEFYYQDKQSVTKNGNTFEALVNKTIQIDFGSNSIKYKSDLDNSNSGSTNSDSVNSDSTNQNYCLSVDLKNEILNLLNAESVCKSSAAGASPNQVCTQAIKPAYAKIISSTDQFSLGSALDGCNKGLVDLCSEASIANLKNISNKIKTNLSQYLCD